MSLGLVARADQGGIGTQTYEIARHLWPDRILVVRLNDPRGSFDASRYDGLSPEVRICGNPAPAEELAWLAETGHVLAVEDYYNDTLPRICRRADARLSLHANPELFARHHRAAAAAQELWPLAPTDWMLDRMPETTELLWMPVALDRLQYRARGNEPRRFLHVSAPAMADRNGTDLLVAALELYDGPEIELYVSGPARPDEPLRLGVAEVVPLEPVVDYGDRYEERFDALILPRRYGGLSLVMQEALAAGLPVVCLDRHPENEWGGVRTVPVVSEQTVAMKGGDFPVAACDPAELARTIREHAESDPLPLSFAARAWARSISWGHLLGDWQETFS